MGWEGLLANRCARAASEFHFAPANSPASQDEMKLRSFPDPRRFQRKMNRIHLPRKRGLARVIGRCLGPRLESGCYGCVSPTGMHQRSPVSGASLHSSGISTVSGSFRLRTRARSQGWGRAFPGSQLYSDSEDPRVHSSNGSAAIPL